MKFVVLGDVHGRFDAIWSAFAHERPDAILHVGDLAMQDYAEKRLDVGEYPEKLPPVPFVWVLGNHENLETYEGVGKPLGFLASTTLGGNQILGVGGIPGKKRDIHWGVNRTLDVLAKISRAFILVSHETCAPFTKNGTPMGSPELAHHCRRLRPKFHFSGHHHYADVQMIDGVAHYRLPYAWDGYAVYEDGRVRRRPRRSVHDGFLIQKGPSRTNLSQRI